MKRYTFTPDTLTVCGQNSPDGKTFPARYELQPRDAMKRGQKAPAVYIFATVDEKTVKIAVQPDDDFYDAAYQAAQQPAPDTTPADHSDQPAPDPVKKRYFEVGYDTGVCFSVNIIWTECENAEQAARDTAEEHAKKYGYTVSYLKETTENHLKEVKEKGMPIVKADAATPADHSEDEQPAPAETPADHSEVEQQPAADQAEQPAAETTPADHSEEQPAAEEQPATPADHSEDEQPAQAKQARGPIPEKTFIGTTITGARYQIIFDDKAQRTRVIIPAEYRSAARETVEKAGFYYSSALDSWNKKLTFRAYRAAVILAAELEKVLSA